jgi:hypothetical protein
MIATAKPCPRNDSVPAWHQPFLEMLPAIQRQARIAFLHLDPEAREDAIQEVVANALCAVVRLAEQNKTDLAYATPLARYGIHRVKAGRQVGGKLNVRDITSKHCQLSKSVRVDQLDQYNDDAEDWKEVLVEDRHVGPDVVAATRIDFADWLRILPARYRRIANVLASGESTGATAKRFKVSSGRISQIRRELKESWEVFQGQPEVETAMA